MASKKRRSYRGTPAEHAKDAAYFTRQLRVRAKKTVAQAKAGNCGIALMDFERLAEAAGIATASKAYSHARREGGADRLTTRSAVRNAVGRAREAVAVCYEQTFYRDALRKR